jgi:hypothetical protein
MEDLYENISDWAYQFTGEQTSLPEPAYMSKEYRRVRRQLRRPGQLVILVGSRGIGKSTMLSMIHRDYIDTSLKIKWRGLDWFLDELQRDFQSMKKHPLLALAFLLEEVVMRYSLETVMKRVERLFAKNSDEVVTLSIFFKERFTADYDDVRKWGILMRSMVLLKILNVLFSMLPKKVREEFLMRALIERYRILLIDFMDYGVNDRSKILKDINGVQNLWLLLESYSEDLTPNLVLTMQKELVNTAPHFFLNKCHLVDLKPVSSEELVKLFNAKFKDSPFEDKAVMELAQRSRGNFRQFMKYVYRCMEGWQDEAEEGDSRTITPDRMREWIRDEHTAGELALLFSNVFPKSAKNAGRASDIMELLRRDGSADQALLIREFFMEPGVNPKTAAVNASRLLKQLEIHDMIEKKRVGHSNVWKLTGTTTQ